MTEGELLKQFIDSQKKTKVSIAKDLKMTKQNLFQFFKARDLSIETKKKFEDYFGQSIFTNGWQVNEPESPDYPSAEFTVTEKNVISLVHQLIKEVAKLKSNAFGGRVKNIVKELFQDATLARDELDEK